MRKRKGLLNLLEFSQENDSIKENGEEKRKNQTNKAVEKKIKASGIALIPC